MDISFKKIREIIFRFIRCIFFVLLCVFVGAFLMLYFLNTDKAKIFYEKYYSKDDPLFKLYEPSIDFTKYTNDTKDQKAVEKFVTNLESDSFNKEEVSKLNVRLLTEFLKQSYEKAESQSDKISKRLLIKKTIDTLPTSEKQYMQYKIFIDDIPVLRRVDHNETVKDGVYKAELVVKAKEHFIKHVLSVEDYSFADLNDLRDICSKIRFYSYYGKKPSRISIDSNEIKVKSDADVRCSEDINKIRKHLNKSIIDDFVLFFKNGGLDYYRYADGRSGVMYAISNGLSLDKAWDFEIFSHSRAENMILNGYMALDVNVDRYLNVIVLTRFLLDDHGILF